MKESAVLIQNAKAYAEIDIMLAVHYIDHIAEPLQRPIVIFLGINQPGISSWNRTIRPVSVRQSDASRVAVVTSAGNEAGKTSLQWSGF